MKKSALWLSIVGALASAPVQNAAASAFALSEQGVSGLGTAYAGSAAVAEDASTVWWNPAGMSRLPRGRHLAVAGHLIMPSTKFNNRSSTGAALQTPGGNGGDAGDTAFVPNVFYAMDLNPKWSFGVGVNVPFGLATEYDSDWIGRFQGIESEVKTLNINPSLSYKLNERASIGFGLNYQHGEIDLLSAVNYSAAAAAAGALGLVGLGAEGQNKTSIDGDAWGFNIGVLWDVGSATRLGLHYRSSLDYEMEGSTSFSNVPGALAASPRLSNGNVKMDVETPATLSLSAVHKLNDRIELLGDVTWTEWSKVDRLPLVRTSGALSGTDLDTLVFNFDDTWRVAVGATYAWQGPWKFRAGVAFDQSPVPNAETRSVRLPDNDRYWFSVGVSYQASPSSRFDVGYTYIPIKDADINNDQSAAGRGIVNGTYEADVNLLSLQYQYSF